MSRDMIIVGAKGQLGIALQERFPNAVAVDRDQLDITDRSSVEAFDWSQAKVILNAAAYTNVDGAESLEGRKMAWAVNADAVANLTAAAAQYDSVLVHISTDYVFDGIEEPHKEDEAFAPLSVYGASKAAGDIAVSLAPKYYILRTSWVIGEGKNFVRTMIDLGKRGISPSVVDDQIGRLTFATVIVSAIDFLLKNDAPYGSYNVTNEGDSVSWAAIASKIFELSSMPNTVTPVSTQEYYKDKEGIAPRPLKSTLDLSKIKALGFIPSEWQKDLSSYVKKELTS